MTTTKGYLMNLHALRRRSTWIATALFALPALMLSGCGGGGDGGGGDRSSGTLSVSMVDAPPGPDVTAVNVTISRVEANVGGTWIELNTTPRTYNLLTLARNEVVIGSATLPAGRYNQVRFFPSAATVVDGTGTHDVTIPSGVQTGIKVNVNFDLTPNQVTTVLLDFNVHKSLVKQGNGQYLLQPVIPAVVKVLSGTVTGTVTDGTNPLKGAVVTATYTAGGNYTIGTEVNTGTSLADGTFKIWALLPGTYTLTVSYTNPTTGAIRTVTRTGVTVTANQDTAVGALAVQ